MVLSKARCLSSMILLIPITILISCSPGSKEPDDLPPFGMVLLIGDGMSVAAIEALRLHSGAPAMTGLTVDGRVQTDDVRGRTTDSAAAATAYATGYPTYNGAISVGPDSIPLETIFEVAEAHGMATGVVATSSVTHATPAAFIAHVPSRSQEYEIARQITASGVDVVLGGGWRFFDPSRRRDGTDILAPLEDHGYSLLRSSGDLAEFAATDSVKVIGLFSNEGMPHADVRSPNLTEMAEAALGAVMRDPDGFILMIEGSQIDWAAHDNESERFLDEMVEFDRTVAIVRELVAIRPNTLMVVTSDHVTGGPSVEAGQGPGEVAITWSTTGHTSETVPIYASGIQAGRFSGLQTNYEVGLKLKEILLSVIDPTHQ